MQHGEKAGYFFNIEMHKDTFQHYFLKVLLNSYHKKSKFVHINIRIIRNPYSVFLTRCFSSRVTISEFCLRDLHVFIVIFLGKHDL